MKKARERLGEVLEKANRVRATTRDGLGHSFVDKGLYAEWHASATSIVSRLDLRGSYVEAFGRVDKENDPSGDKFEKQFGILRGLAEDFDGGHLADIRGFVRAEVFADFISQAQFLFSEGWWQPVPVIVGAVLEDHLRKLCAKYPAIQLPDKPKLDWMNIELRKAGEYDLLRQKQVTVWAELRNKAAHGEWDAYKEADVEAILRDVPRFLNEHRA